MAPRKSKTSETAEFGDFQTPPPLALEATKLLQRLGVQPQSIVEPTCGRGAFLQAAVSCYPDATIIGVDINKQHLADAKGSLPAERGVTLRHGDFFKTDWAEIFESLPGPHLILGNPPWVTSSDLGALDSDNLPEKSNFQNHSGIDAITGKSNFDISEWMILRYLDWIQNNKGGTIAILCKTAVARKILLHMWKVKCAFSSAYIYKINALKHFSAAVDACFFVVSVDGKSLSTECYVHDDINAANPSRIISHGGGLVIWNKSQFEKSKDIIGSDPHYTWRSGIKHDCSKIMELSNRGTHYENALGERIDIEDNYIYPMLKSSDIANGRLNPRMSMIVTQRFVGESTSAISELSPRTWRYLSSHGNLLDKRGSVIYKNKPRFSIFGVGEYSFAPWKVAISGFYKKLMFTCVGPVNGKPVVFDDTIYFLPCKTEEESRFICDLLSSDESANFFDSIIYWDDKRPITVDLLKRLHLGKLSSKLGQYTKYEALISKEEDRQRSLMIA